MDVGGSGGSGGDGGRIGSGRWLRLRKQASKGTVPVKKRGGVSGGTRGSNRRRSK